MPDHTVQLHYTSAGFTPTPNPILVHPGQTISFVLAPGGPPEGKIRITFRDPQFFSAGQFHSGDSDVRVTAKPGHTTYHCELLVNGQVIARSQENSGGDIMPDSTT